jgi:hypothetical protein
LENEDSVSTALRAHLTPAPQLDEENTATGLPKGVFSQFLARVVIATALTMNPHPVCSMHWGRKEAGAEAESSTAPAAIEPSVLREVRDLFDRGETEFFQDGMHSQFSRSLLRLLCSRPSDTLLGISHYARSGGVNPSVVSEALRWVAEVPYDLQATARQWALLKELLRDPSPIVRDGAILAFAALDDRRAVKLLTDAKDREVISELHELIDQVLQQLNRPS